MTLRRRGGVVTQRPAKPFTPVRFRSAPLGAERNRHLAVLEHPAAPRVEALSSELHGSLRHRTPSIPPRGGRSGLRRHGRRVLAASGDEAHAVALVLENVVAAPAAVLALVPRGGEWLCVHDRHVARGLLVLRNGDRGRTHGREGRNEAPRDPVAATAVVLD